MAAATEPEGVFPDRDEIPSSSAVGTDINSPPAAQNSEMGIDESPDIHDSSSKEEDATDSLMPPPEIDHHELELPLLPASGEESNNSRAPIFASEIPDSEGVSDCSNTIDDAKPGYESSNASPIKGDPGQLGVLNHAVPVTLSTQGETSLTAASNTAEQEKSPVSGDEKTGFEFKAVPEILTTALDNTLYDEPSITVRNTVPPSTQNSSSESNSDFTSHVSLDNGDTAQASGSNIMNNHPAEKSQAEVDMATAAANSVCMSFRDDDRENPLVETSDSYAPDVLESTPIILDLRASKATQLSSEEQYRGVPPNPSSIFPEAQKVEDDSSQTSAAQTPAASFRGPLEPQNKNIMMAELKAIKITSLQSRNLALQREIAEKRTKLEEISKDLEYPAGETVKRHIALLHDYNDIRDIGQGLIGMIADNRGVRIGELYEEFGVGLKD